MKPIAILSTILISLISFQSAGQHVSYVGNSPEFQKFKSSTLAVVQTGIESYDSILLNTMEKYWTFNKFVLIDSNEIDKYLQNSYHLMMILQVYSNGIFIYEELAILQENPEFKGNRMKSKEIASAPLSNLLERTPEGLALRLPYIIKTLNDLVSHCDTIVMKKIHTTSVFDSVRTFLNKDAYRIPNLTLLVPSYLFEEHASYSASKKPYQLITKELMESYPYKYEIMDWETILLMQEDPDEAVKYCLFMPVQFSSMITTHIYDLNTRQILFNTISYDRLWYDKIIMRNVIDDLEDYVEETKK